jgi:DNA polymerase
MFIGEGPGQREDIAGRPFVGQAGKFLDTLLSETCLVKRDTFICNIVRCRPPSNRQPLPDEIQACTPYLDRQMKAIQPKVIVTLGNCSTGYVFSKANLRFTSMTQRHGRPYEKNILDMMVTVFPTYHPAAALYSAKYKEQLIEDFQMLRSELLKRGFLRRSSSQ